MAKQNILVFPCGSEVALEVVEACRYSRHFHLIGASSVDDHGRFAFEDYVDGLPMLGDEELIPRLAAVVAERDVAAIYPAMDGVIAELKAHEAELGCVVVSSCVSTTQTCLSKRATYAALADAVRVPALYESPEEATYPAFAKPDVGYGSRGTYVVDGPADWPATAAADAPQTLVLEYLPGEEYTVDCFTRADGTLLYAAARTRARVRTGISVRTTFVDDQTEFEEFAAKVNAAIPFRGAWFVQVKRDAAGELCLLEIAARLGGSSALSRARGVNLALASIFDALGFSVDFVPNAYNPVLDRSLGTTFDLGIDYSCAYVDYDDCTIVDGAVNTELAAFLYQCHNRGVRTVLLSRHDGNLEEDMAHYRVENLFDEVIHIAQDEKKSNYITSRDAIYIDDSYAERLDVSKLGIPVFAPDMVGCLLR